MPLLDILVFRQSKVNKILIIFQTNFDDNFSESRIGDCTKYLD